MSEVFALMFPFRIHIKKTTLMNDDQLLRYSRQIMLPQLDIEGQQKLLDSHVLIIGLGGGPDVQAALQAGAREITGVEVNARMIELVTGPFTDFVGRPYSDPRVTIMEADGRHIVQRSAETYDIIQLTGVDTTVAALGGNPNLSENYLYTIESFSEYYKHLSPDGLLSVSFPDFALLHPGYRLATHSRSE